MRSCSIAVIIIGTLFVNPYSAKGDMVDTINLLPNALPTTQAALQQIARQSAIKYGLNVNHFLAVESCEIRKTSDGNWDYMGQSQVVRNGVQENSWGAFQINLNAHPTITKGEAQDPLWATDWAAQEWVSGQASEWSCYKILYG